jgi:hypothetical protein
MGDEMILEGLDVIGRKQDPTTRDVAKALPSGACDQEWLKLTADDGSFVETSWVETPLEVWDEEIDDFIFPEERMLVRYHDGRTGKSYVSVVPLSRLKAKAVFLEFLVKGKIRRGRSRWRQEGPD